MTALTQWVIAVGVVVLLVLGLAVRSAMRRQDQADAAAPNTNQSIVDADVTMLGPRPENDAIFGTYPNLRVPTAIDWPTEKIPRYEADDAN